MLTRRQISAGMLATVLSPSLRARAQSRMGLRFITDSLIDGTTAPLLLAIDRDYFAAEGLDIFVEAGAGARESVMAVASGRYDLGFGDFNAVMRMRDDNQRANIRAVSILHDQPAFAVIGRKSLGIDSDPKSLVGARIGATSGEATFAQWPLFQKLVGLSAKAVQLETVGFSVREPMLVQGELDAVLGFSMSSNVDLQARDVPRADVVTLLMSSYGLELYGNAIVAGGKFLQDNPEAVRGFMRGFTHGLRETIVDPVAAIDCVLKRSPNASRDLELERLHLMLSQNVLTPYVRENGFGTVDVARFARSIDQHQGISEFKRRPQLDDVFASGFLPADTDRRIG